MGESAHTLLSVQTTPWGLEYSIHGVNAGTSLMALANAPLQACSLSKHCRLPLAARTCRCFLCLSSLCPAAFDAGVVMRTTRAVTIWTCRVPSAAS